MIFQYYNSLSLTSTGIAILHHFSQNMIVSENLKRDVFCNKFCINSYIWPHSLRNVILIIIYYAPTISLDFQKNISYLCPLYNNIIISYNKLPHLNIQSFSQWI